MPKLQIIIASTRPGRVGLPVAQWFQEQAVKHAGFEIEMIDLADWNLPMMDEPNHPRFRRYEHQHTKDWSAKIDEADAYAFVFPEYNYGISAPLKNALDYLHQEWQYKPAGLVSYGGVAAGSRAAQMLKQVLSAVKVVPLFEAVTIPFVSQFLTDEGQSQGNEIMEDASRLMLDELVRWSGALKTLRS
jgi:NAD(P)H-dependent FMN reductase